MSLPAASPVPDKKVLQAQLAADELEQCLAQLQSFADTASLPDVAREALLLAARLEDLRRDSRAGDTPPDTLNQVRNGIRRALLDLIEGMPEAGDKAASPARAGMSERRFKMLIFSLMAVGKLCTVAYIVLHIDTGGFTQQQGLSVIALLLPAFTAYVGVMLAEVIQRRNEVSAAKPGASELRPVSRAIRVATFTILPLYFLLLWTLISRYTAGYWEKDGESDFGALTTWLAILESGFGVYVGQIVYGLFKGGEKG